MESLIKVLSKKGIIKKDQAASLEFEIKSSGKKEEEVILDKRIVKESFLFSLKGELLDIPYRDASLGEVPLKILELIPEDSARYYGMIPLGRKEKLVEVGMIYPEDLKAQEALKFLSRQGNFSYNVLLISPSLFKGLLKKYRTLKREVNVALEELETELKEEKIKARSSVANEFEALAEEAPITKIVAVMLRHAVEGNASDIHIEPMRSKLRIRFRLDGILHSSIFLPVKIHQAVIARIKILSKLKIDETRVPQDGRFSTKVGDRDIDFRISTFPTTLGEKAAIRVLDPTMGLKSFSDLGLDSRNLNVIQRAIKKSYGLILSTGPTGSGKTTTLYAVLGMLNREGVNVMTLEDPVEYFIGGVNQSQIKPEIGYTFGSGLRFMLRQDPDIIMVGEIRDEETASLVTHAALTGHVVLSTLHTSNSLGVIPRMIDLGVQPFLIPPTLSVAIAQRLARKLCPECKREIEPDPETKKEIMKEINEIPLATRKNIKIKNKLYIYEPQGCKKCNNTGYSGRMGIFEVLEMTKELSSMILKRPSEEEIAKEAKRQGMITMKQDGILKALKGLISISEVMRVAEGK